MTNQVWEYTEAARILGEAVSVRKERVRFVVITKTKLLWIGLAILGLLALLAVVTTRTLPIVGDELQLRRADVVLDAGHGGIDSGAHDGAGVYEKDIVLDVVLRMREYLARYGLTVELTRETDQDLSGFETHRRGRHRQDLANRVKIMNQGQVAVSIHVNAIADPSVHGAVVFYARGSEQGKLLAEKVLAELGKVQHLNHSFVVPRENIYVLRNTSVPTILVELGFISNAEDKAKLITESYRQTLAEAVSRGILDYFEVELEEDVTPDGAEGEEGPLAPEESSRQGEGFFRRWLPFLFK
ncbi:MAG: N-acetylmuramoyl-L-alanine amidase [Firmicutes bacterium]|nr:N-acetylmuramoyl-L-alanine amidase [Bacillota bacterium]